MNEPMKPKFETKQNQRFMNCCKHTSCEQKKNIYIPYLFMVAVNHISFSFGLHRNRPSINVELNR